jgi:XTP/dITP diphosphohydrolase
MDLSKGLLIATSNKGKIKEIKQILGDIKNIKIVLLSEIHGHSFEVEEHGKTVQENALIKAKAYAEKFGYVALADDSGLEVDYLNGAPGINSARYAGVEATDEDRVKKLLIELKDIPTTKRTARFKCSVCLYDPSNGDKIFAEGICPGVIGLTSSGSNGFGYDPIFIPDGCKCTMAELSPEQKNSISHRGNALKSLKEKLFVVRESF